MRPNSLKLGSKLRLDNEDVTTTTTSTTSAAPVALADDEDFYAKQSRLQMQARVALAQAKDLARMEMEVSERKSSGENKRSRLFRLQSRPDFCD